MPAKTSTAHVTSAAVSTTGGSTARGRNVRGGCRTATTMRRTKKTTVVDANTVNGPNQMRRLISKCTNETWFLTPIPPHTRSTLCGRAPAFEQSVNREPLDGGSISVAKWRRGEEHAV